METPRLLAMSAGDWGTFGAEEAAGGGASAAWFEGAAEAGRERALGAASVCLRVFGDRRELDLASIRHAGSATNTKSANRAARLARSRFPRGKRAHVILAIYPQALGIDAVKSRGA